MLNRFFYILLTFTIFLSACQDEDLPEPDNAPPFVPIDLHEFSSGMRGFNLLGKFDHNWSNNGFSEEDFIIINDLGFNFARLPLDYLTYTMPGDWNSFIEEEMAEIDQAINWGKQYGIHICINFHRAPGYSVNQSPIPPSQQVDLWSNQAAQEAFINHWKVFAERYKDIPNDELSFNLINEPDDQVPNTTYISIMTRTIETIHKINPNRVIFVDGYNYANDIMAGFKDTRNVIQAIHVYEPFTLTHYKANWVEGSDSWPEPVWPMLDISSYLYGPWKSEYQSSLVLNGDFPEGTQITINVNQVSLQSTLEVVVDDQQIYTKPFICGPEKGEDWTEIILTEWGYQNISNKDYSTTAPKDGSTITISNIQGDWMTYNSITINTGEKTIEIIPGNNSWGSKQDSYVITENGDILDTHGNSLILLELQEKLAYAQSQNIPVMIQEFGVHNQTPHEVTLSYLKDVVPIFQEYNLGYALWNLEGSLGIINSGRSDVTYESYRGKNLDRQMLDILQSSGIGGRFF